MRISSLKSHSIRVPFYRRHLPHLYEIGKPLFLTWRLYGSLPSNRAFPETVLTSGQAFITLDRLLDEGRTGPLYLRIPEIARTVIESIEYHAAVLKRYDMHAFVVMPNHVHLLLTPQVVLPRLTRTLKSFTAKRANQALGLTGRPFWQEESYDRLVRNQKEFDRIAYYIEQNPVRAGLVKDASDYPWSSAGRVANSLVGRPPGEQPVA
jgi:putative transposase